MERTELLTKAARASYFHPLRADTPLEVLTLSLRNAAQAILVREAVVALWDLHASGDHAAYSAAMTAISPWRDNYLYAKDLPRTGFPVIAVEINSVASLEAAEGLFSSVSETLANGKMQLFLRLDVPEYAEDVEEIDADVWVRVVKILKLLKSRNSSFQLALVELQLGIVRMDHDEDALAVCELLKLALLDAQSVRAFRVAFELSSMPASQSTLRLWACFFQTVCRLGCDVPAEDGNELAVAFSGKIDGDILEAFWSAVACSREYSRLFVDQLRQHTDNDVLVASYTAVALLSSVNDIKNVEWRRKDVSEIEVDAMAHVQTAVTSEKLLRVMTNPGSSSKLNSAETLLTSPERLNGHVIYDDRDSHQLQVLVGGVGVVAVDRDKWVESVGEVCVVPPTTFSRSKLTHLHLELDLNHADGQLQVTRLFSIFGASLLILRIDSPSRSALTADGLLAILESCPLLRQVLANKFELPVEHVQVDPSRIVTTSLIKLQLLRLTYPNERNTVTNHNVAQAFFGSVIPLVGIKLEYLELRREKGILPFRQAFEKIVTLCPSLFHFKLECLDVQTLDSLIEAYRGGSSRVSSLYLLKSPVESASVVRFAEFLGDRTCIGSKKLGVLHINHTSSDLHEAVQLVGLDASSLKAILEMLEANCSLTELYLGVNDAGVGQIVSEPLRPFKRRFDIYDDEEIPAASERFPIESTVAFVDALQTRNLPWEPEIVSVIAGFAAQRVRRSVRYDIISHN